MGQLGAGYGTSFPLAIDTRQFFQNAAAAAPDSDTRFDAEALNDLMAAVVAIQVALGARPQGTFGSVAARLNQFIPGGGVGAGMVTFSNTQAIAVSGTVLNLGAPAVFWAAYGSGTVAPALAPETVTISVDQFSYNLIATFAQAESGSLVIASSGPQYFTTFTGATDFTIPGAAHLLGSPVPFWQLYDNSSPAVASIRPQALTVHPISHDVRVTFGQAQSGTLLLGVLSPQYIANFTAQTTLTIPGTTHALGTAALLWQVYDSAIPAAAIEPESLTVNQTTYDVTVTFGQAQSGTVVLAVAPPPTGLDFDIRDGGLLGSTAVRVFSNTGNLGLRAGAGGFVAFQEKTGVNRVLVNTATSALGLGLFPTYQLQLSTNSAAKPGDALWTVASDRRQKEDITPYQDGLSVLRQLVPVWFKYNGQGGSTRDGERHVGLIAQEVQPIAPYLVGSQPGKLTPEGPETTLLHFKGNALLYMLINTVKELATRLDQAETTLAALHQGAAPGGVS
jgi:hypothetical protein